jgi:hypothetical protein
VKLQRIAVEVESGMFKKMWPGKMQEKPVFRRMYAGAFKLETVVGTPRLRLPGVISGYPVVHPPDCE